MGAAFSGAILESKGNAYDFSEKLQKRPKNWKKKGDKIFENLGKNVQNLKILWKKAGDCVRLSHTNSQKMPCFFISSKATV